MNSFVWPPMCIYYSKVMRGGSVALYVHTVLYIPFLVDVSVVLGFIFQCACWQISEAESKQKDSVMGPYATVDYNLQHIYHGQPNARVNLNPMPESTLSASQGLCIWPLHSKCRNLVSEANYRRPTLNP
jgi:hypothetical protein